jgi:hypothetical protein
MKTSLLLPARYKRIGIILFIPSLVLGILCRFWDFSFDFLTLRLPSANKDANTGKLSFEGIINFTDEFAITGLILSLLFIAFAREKQEDEFIHQNRLESWQWAVVLNYVLLLIAIWFVHGMEFIDVMMYNMLTVLIIFIIRFNYVLYKNKVSISSNPA